MFVECWPQMGSQGAVLLAVVARPLSGRRNNGGQSLRLLLSNTCAQ